MDLEEIEGRKWVLIDMGQAVLAVQSAERVIRHSLHYILPAKPLKTLKNFMRAREALSKATLGQMATILRERVDLHEDFDQLMTRFVKNRNMLTHHINDVPGFDMRTIEGRAIGRQWLTSLMEDTDAVVEIFCALHLSYAEATGIDRNEMKSSLDLVGPNYIDTVEASFRWKSGD